MGRGVSGEAGRRLYAVCKMEAVHPPRLVGAAAERSAALFQGHRPPCGAVPYSRLGGGAGDYPPGGPYGVLSGGWHRLPLGGRAPEKGTLPRFFPGELLELYFEPEEEGAEDLWITFRRSAWENLENSALLAFCGYGDEDSLLYLGLCDGAVYYLSARQKIANTLEEFLDRLDEKVDYFTAR